MESLSERLRRLNPGGISFVTPEEDDMMLMNSMKSAARKEGEESGMKKGIAKGTRESQKEIIGNMLSIGLSLDTIAKYTNINKNIIESMRNELNI